VANESLSPLGTTLRVVQFAADSADISIQTAPDSLIGGIHDGLVASLLAARRRKSGGGDHSILERDSNWQRCTDLIFQDEGFVRQLGCQLGPRAAEVP
jgi:hypothetical protein